MRVIYKSMLKLRTQNYPNQQMRDETTACQIWLVSRDTVYSESLSLQV